MAKKRYRPLDDFNQSLEDQELEQLEGFEFGRDPKKTKARSSSYSNPYSSPVDFETPEEQETYQRISKGMKRLILDQTSKKKEKSIFKGGRIKLAMKYPAWLFASQ